MLVTERAPGKVNLSLLVSPRRRDGYHDLFTVFLPVQLHDELTFDLSVAPIPEALAPVAAPARDRAVEGRTLTLRCPGLEGDDNLVIKALRALEEACGRTIFGKVSIEKGLPVGGGMGGGSSDAAAALRMGTRLLAQDAGIDVSAAQLHKIARSLGADVPFFLGEGAAIGRGVGDELKSLKLPALELVVLFPGAFLSTKTVYETFDRVASTETAEGFIQRAGRAEAAWLEASLGWSLSDLTEQQCVERIGCLLENDLERASFALLPELAGIKDAIVRAGAIAALMSGSGPTMFGLCLPAVAEAQVVAERLRQQGFNATSPGA